MMPGRDKKLNLNPGLSLKMGVSGIGDENPSLDGSRLYTHVYV